VKTAIWNTILLVSAVMLLGGCSTSESTVIAATGTPPQLFTLEPTPERTALKKTASGYLATLLAEPANAEVTLVKVNPALINPQTPDLAVSLPDGKTAQFHLRDFASITTGIDGWVGYKPSGWKQAHSAPASEIDNDPLYYLSLAREGEKIVGNIIVAGQRYRLEYIGPGQHALIKVDESKLPPGGEPLPDPQGIAGDNTQGKVPQSTHSTIRVMFVTTNQKKAKTPDYRLVLAQALNDANQYMKNSDVQITYELAGFFTGEYDETGRSYKQQLEDMRLAEGFAPQLLREREALRADMVSMFSSATQYCGLAWVTAGSAMAHSVISCSWALAHELGHNLGASHDWDEGDAERRPPYMFGYRYSGPPGFSTQMSYGCSGCPGIPYHSNPRLTYQNIPMGTAEHHDAARRFNERRETVEDFYPPADWTTLRVQYFDDLNFRGGHCYSDLVPGIEAASCSRARSIKVVGFTPGMRLCFKADHNSKVCYLGVFAGNFEVGDLKATAPLPEGLVREGDEALIGDVKSAEYAMDYIATIQLYSGANYEGQSCQFRLPKGTVQSLTEWPQCAALGDGKSRSAKIYAYSGPANKLCFFNADHRKSLCFTGDYKGNFSIRNWDVGSGLPRGLVRTHRGGGYMNGDVHRISYGYDSEGWPPAP